METIRFTGMAWDLRAQDQEICKPAVECCRNRTKGVVFVSSASFVTKGSEVQILFPRPILSTRYKRFLVSRPQRRRRFCSCEIPKDQRGRHATTSAEPSHFDLSSGMSAQRVTMGQSTVFHPLFRLLASSCGAVIHQDHFLPYGAGTFGLLVTLKKRERCEKCRRKIARIELAHRL